jgi:putative flippase GtrA
VKTSVKSLKRPTKRGVIQFTWYNLGGAAFFVIGYLIFVLLYGPLHWPWLPAKIVADFTGWAANFVIQYFLAFREETKNQHAHKTTVKFTAFSLVNLLIDYAIVGFLNWIGITPFIGLFVAAGFFTIWKWLWYKRWVFKKHTDMA